MAYVSTEIIRDGWTGNHTDETDEFSVQFIVTVDDKQDGPDYILHECRLPQPGDPYLNVGNDNLLGAWCKTVNVSPLGETTWRATAKYAPLKDDAEEDEPMSEDGDKPEKDPSKQGVDISVSLVQMSRAAVSGAYIGQMRDDKVKLAADAQWHGGPIGKPDGSKVGFGPPAGDAITNSANIAFDPAPEIDYSRTAVSISRNQKQFDSAKYLHFADTVNADPFNLKFPDPNPKKNAFELKVKALEAKMQAIQVQRRVSTKGLLYWRVTFEFHIDRIFGWRAQILDRGFSQNASWDANNETWLDAAVAGAPAAAAVPIVTDGGFTATEPQLFDGKGRVKGVGTPPVFLIYALYKEIAWAPLKLNNPGWEL